MHKAMRGFEGTLQASSVNPQTFLAIPTQKHLHIDLTWLHGISNHAKILKEWETTAQGASLQTCYTFV